MTTLDVTSWTCPLCGNDTQRTVVASTNQLEGPDLDMRPGEMERSTISYRCVRCPACGYVQDADEDPTDAQAATLRKLVAEDRYGEQLVDRAYPGSANEFLCAALGQERIGRGSEAGWCALAAAWVCDDDGASDAATACRSLAVELWRAAIAVGDLPTAQDGAEHVLLADVLRRTQRFDEARSECESGLESHDTDEELGPILRYLLALIADRDGARHTFDELPTAH